MAKLHGDFKFTGTIGNLVGYRGKNPDSFFLRKKKVISAKQVAESPNFEHTRKLNSEWKACVTAMREIKNVIKPFPSCIDSNYTGKLNGLAKRVQKCDNSHQLGQRAIEFSKHPYWLEHFNFSMSRQQSLILANISEFTVSRSEQTASAMIPITVPFHINTKQERVPIFYRYGLALGCIADLIYEESEKKYVPTQMPDNVVNVHYSDWFYSGNTLAAFLMSTFYDGISVVDGSSLILSVAIECGMMAGDSQVHLLSKQGALRVLKVI